MINNWTGKSAILYKVLFYDLKTKDTLCRGHLIGHKNFKQCENVDYESLVTFCLIFLVVNFFYNINFITLPWHLFWASYLKKLHVNKKTKTNKKRNNKNKYKFPIISFILTNCCVLREHKVHLRCACVLFCFILIDRKEVTCTNCD